ncbi:hypothetical protein [Luteolibacter sp. LG18]|uniref:hypothetical protein n=1 Tax=Luteolibacter sp. LG18 TaxID=2819286 RepID=UPI002B318EB0|nr:hypothetical protein llg_27270 [Luteolibacter sp. LG18]
MKRKRLACLLAVVALVVVYAVTAHISASYGTRSTGVDGVGIRLFRPLLREVLNVHSSDRYALKIGGKDYPNVEGNYPYFLSVPEIDSVVFRFDRNNDRDFTTVVRNLRDGREFLFHHDLTYLPFGDPLVTVKKADQEVIVVSCRGKDYTLDLEAGRIRIDL